TVTDGVQVRLDQGAFPATTADLNSDEFLNREFPYFGGQQINKVLAESAAGVLEGWQFLPFQEYATSIFGDTVGRAFIGEVTLQEGFANWQQRLVTFGETQGFTIQ